MDTVDDGPSWRHIAVLGLDTVGTAWVAAAARAGLRVTAVETDRARLDTGHRRLLGHHPDLPPNAIALATTQEPLTGPDLIVDALPPTLDGRERVLERVAELSRPDAVLAATGSTRPPGAAPGTRRSITAHLSDPARPHGLLEVVSTSDTRGPVDALAGRLGWSTVHLPARPGLIGDALLLGYRNSAARMCQAGYASATDIDVAMMFGCGLPCGPLAELDRIGVAEAHHTLTELHALTGDDVYAPAAILGTGGPLAAPAPAAPAEAVTGRPIQKVGIVGAGTMATGIAEACIGAGFPVLLVGRSPDRATAARATVEAALQRRVRRGRLTAEGRDALLGRFSVGAEPGELASCDLVVEAIVEDLAAKRAVIAALDGTCDEDAILATTTSCLSVTACAAASEHPERVVGLHFFNPAPVMRLVEVGRTAHTAPGVLATAHAFCTALGKHGVTCGDRAGFIGNALLLPYLNRAALLLQSGYATAAEIDEVIEQGHGYPMGPFRVMDTVGLDVVEAAVRALHEAFGEPGSAPAALITELIAQGRLGRKSGHGFHEYDHARGR